MKLGTSLVNLAWRVLCGIFSTIHFVKKLFQQRKAVHEVSTTFMMPYLVPELRFQSRVRTTAGCERHNSSGLGALDQYVWDSTEFEGVDILVSRRVWHGFASVNCCGTGLILSRNSVSSLCGETLSYKKSWTSGRPKSCARWPSCKLVRLTSLTTSPCPGAFRYPLLISCTRPVSGSSHTS